MSLGRQQWSSASDVKANSASIYSSLKDKWHIQYLSILGKLVLVETGAALSLPPAQWPSGLISGCKRWLAGCVGVVESDYATWDQTVTGRLTRGQQTHGGWRLGASWQDDMWLKSGTSHLATCSGCRAIPLTVKTKQALLVLGLARLAREAHTEERCGDKWSWQVSGRKDLAGNKTTQEGSLWSSLSIRLTWLSNLHIRWMKTNRSHEWPGCWSIA